MIIVDEDMLVGMHMNSFRLDNCHKRSMLGDTDMSHPCFNLNRAFCNACRLYGKGLGTLMTHS